MVSTLVSVIIPCWNGERFVAEAIESALSQTYADMEVIVIDDGSTDATQRVLRSFGDRIRWESNPNRGACSARNRGLELARGTLIQFLDADDLLYPDKIARTVPIALQAGPNAITFCGWETTSDPAAAASVTSHQYCGEDPFVFFLKNIILISSPLHWKERLEAVGGFRTELACCQEYDLHLRLAALGPHVVSIPDPLWRQRRTSGSISSNMHKVLLTLEYVLQRWEHDPVTQTSRSRQRALAEQFVKCARLLVRHNDVESALRYVDHAARIDPPSAGLGAFGRRESRWLARALGPVRAEALIQRLSRVARHVSPSPGAR